MEFLKTHIQSHLLLFMKIRSSTFGSGPEHLDSWWSTFHERLNALFLIMLYLLPLSIDSIHLSAIWIL